MTMGRLFIQTCTNQIASWLVHSWNFFDAWTNYRHTQIHNIHHCLDLGEVITFPVIVLFKINYKGCIQLSFCFELGVLKFSRLWKVIISSVDIWLRWDLIKVVALIKIFSKICNMPFSHMYFNVIPNF
jgi:hypothetical protein